MNMTDALRDALLPWYEEKKRDGSMKPHERIPGGYTNNEPPPDGIQMDKINLDRFPRTHATIVREMREILQWWTGLELGCTLRSCPASSPPVRSTSDQR